MTKYWFRKRKGLFKKSDSSLGFDLGWGWVPISWEGWTVTIALIVWILSMSKIEWNWMLFIVGIFIFAFVADRYTEDKVLFKKND